jgi:hypothetical protein
MYMRWDELRATTTHSRLEFKDVLQQRPRRIFPLSLHAPPDVREHARSSMGKTDAVQLIGLDVLGRALCMTCERSARICKKKKKGKERVGCDSGRRGGYLMLTAMIWRMERRTVVATMVGGNCNMDETLDAIWAEVTIQSNALLPVLRLMALRAMKLEA